MFSAYYNYQQEYDLARYQLECRNAFDEILNTSNINHRVIPPRSKLIIFISAGARLLYNTAQLLVLQKVLDGNHQGVGILLNDLAKVMSTGKDDLLTGAENLLTDPRHLQVFRTYVQFIAQYDDPEQRVQHALNMVETIAKLVPLLPAPPAPEPAVTSYIATAAVMTPPPVATPEPAFTVDPKLYEPKGSKTPSLGVGPTVTDNAPPRAHSAPPVFMQAPFAALHAIKVPPAAIIVHTPEPAANSIATEVAPTPSPELVIATIAQAPAHIPEPEPTPTLVPVPQPKQKPAPVPQLTIAQQAQVIIAAGDHAKFDALMLQHKQKPHNKKNILAQLLAQMQATQPEINAEFLCKITLTLDQCLQYLEAKVTPVYTVAIMHNLLSNITYEDVHIHKTHLVDIMSELPLDTDMTQSIFVLFGEKSDRYRAWREPICATEFAYLESLSPTCKFKLKKISHILDTINARGETALMVAIRKQLDAEDIEQLIHSTPDTLLLQQDTTDRQNAVLYWARYVTPHIIPVFAPLARKIIGSLHQQTTRACLAMSPLNDRKERDKYGNTFFHMLILSHPAEPALVSAAVN